MSIRDVQLLAAVEGRTTVGDPPREQARRCSQMSWPPRDFLGDLDHDAKWSQPCMSQPRVCPIAAGVAGSHPASLTANGGHHLQDAEAFLTFAPQAAWPSYRGGSTQKLRPSGSAMTTRLTSSWPMSIRVAPRETRRSTSSCWSLWAGGASSKCSRFFPDFGIIPLPSQESQEIFGPPCGERIAVWRP